MAVPLPISGHFDARSGEAPPSPPGTGLRSERPAAGSPNSARSGENWRRRTASIEGLAGGAPVSRRRRTSDPPAPADPQRNPGRAARQPRAQSRPTNRRSPALPPRRPPPSSGPAWRGWRPVRWPGPDKRRRRSSAGDDGPARGRRRSPGGNLLEVELRESLQENGSEVASSAGALSPLAHQQHIPDLVPEDRRNESGPVVRLPNDPPCGVTPALVTEAPRRRHGSVEHDGHQARPSSRARRTSSSPRCAHCALSSSMEARRISASSPPSLRRVR